MDSITTDDGDVDGVLNDGINYHQSATDSVRHLQLPRFGSLSCSCRQSISGQRTTAEFCNRHSNKIVSSLSGTRRKEQSGGHLLVLNINYEPFAPTSCPTNASNLKTKPSSAHERWNVGGTFRSFRVISFTHGACGCCERSVRAIWRGTGYVRGSFF